MKLKNILKYVAVVLLGGTLVIGGSLYLRDGSQSQTPRFETEAVTRGPVSRSVSSTGTLEALITVQVGSQVSGQIKELDADFNSVVKKNQVLAIIDPANYDAQKQRASAAVATSEAAVANAEATLANRKAELVGAKANVEVSRVSLVDAQRKEKRAKELFADRLIPDQDVESAQTTTLEADARLKQAQAQVNQAEAAINSASAQLIQAQANVKQARADLASAEVNLEHTVIRSPIDGIVIERSVEIGQTVAAAFQAPVLFKIANDLKEMQVTAQVDEADIGLISEQAGVDFTVDAFPFETFHGHIVEIRLGSAASTTSTTSGVVVYNVIVQVENPNLMLRPGMTATVDFTVATVAGGLRIPNAALRYSPTGLNYAGNGTPPSDNRTGEEDQEAPGKPVIAPSGLDQYGIKAGPKVRFPQAGSFRPTWTTVWVLTAEGVPEARKVKLGITNEKETALLEGDLQEGDQLVVRELEVKESRFAASPFGPPRPRNGG